MEPRLQERAINILAINGSPRGASGSTFRLVDAFLQGAAETGAQTDALQLAQRYIHPCTAELNCFLKTPGKCFWHDDMDSLLPKVSEADVLVLATPLYFGGPTGQLKMFVDRLTPLVDPMAGFRRDARGTPRDAATNRHVVLIASCGDWSVKAFDPLVEWVRAVANILHSGFPGALLRSHAPYLRDLHNKGMPPQDVYDAARDAGHQIVRGGTLKKKTLAAVSRALVDYHAYVEHVRASFARAAEAGGALEV